MINKHEDIELFDRYITRQMEGEERRLFEERLNLDKAFRDEFAMYQTVVGGIREFGRAELKDYIKEHAGNMTGQPKFRISRSAWAVAAAVVLIAGIFIVNQFYAPGKSSSNDISINEKQATAPEHPDTTGTVQTPSETLKEINGNKKFEEMDMTPPVIAEKSAGAAEAPPAMVEEPSAADDYAREDVVTIVKEKKLTDSIVLVAVLDFKQETRVFNNSATSSSTPTYQNNSYSKNTYSKGYATNEKRKDKVTSQAEKTEDTKKSEADSEGKDSFVVNKVKNITAPTQQYTLEYWQSPVNFVGYKLSGTTVQLYGLSDRKAKLFVVNNQLYLRSNGKVYLLTACSLGCPFTETDDDNIATFIKSQP